MSEASTEATTSTTSVKPRTPAQIEALQRARVKALEARQRNNELRDKQKEIDRIKYLADRREQFTDEFAPSYWRVNLRDEVL